MGQFGGSFSGCLDFGTLPCPEFWNRLRPTLMKTQTHYRPKRRTKPPASLPSLADVISVGQAAALIASLCKPDWENERSYKNKVRTRINYAIQKQKLHSEDLAKVVFVDFITWAQQQRDWSTGLASLPIAIDHPLKTTLQASSTLQAQLTTLPNRLDECQAALSEAMARIRRLERELDEYRTFCAEYFPCIETGLKTRKQKHLIQGVQNFCLGVAD